VNDNWEETLKNDLIDRARAAHKTQGRMGGSKPIKLPEVSNAFLRNSGDLEKIRSALEQPNNEYLVAEALKRVNELIEMAKQR
tara:strand:+ start:149 stop:397 length:249 start_codon:yes stop_codon:yes gene_type:complete